jgi:polyisoprenoid-binding protein YceI
MKEHEMASTATSALPLTRGRYPFDAQHSGVFFQIKHLGLANVRGMFKVFDATLDVGDSLDDVRVTATIDMASVDTNQPDRDAHLRSTDFFHADEHPQMHFSSRAVRAMGEHEYELDGDLTINGITRPVTLDVEYNGSDVHPGDGRTRVGFTATAEVRRSDYGIDFNIPLGMGKVALGERVKVDLDLEFIAP